MADIGSLIIKIGADASQLSNAFKQLGGSASQFQRGLKTMATVASTAFLGATSAAVAMTIAAGRQAEELEQLATITGINTDKLQEYDVMLNRAGLSGNDLALVMKTLGTNLDEARRGTGSAADRFRQLGIDIRTVTSTDDLIQKIAQSQAKFADGTKKAAIMSDLLGKGWQTFMRAFAGGKKSFDEIAQASKQLGLTLSQSNIAVLGQMDNQLDDLQTAFKRFGQQLAVTLAPSIEFVTKLLIKFLDWGSRVFHEMNLMLDIFAAKVTQMALQAGEVFGTLFSTNIFSGEAWKQTLANLEFISKETDKQIAKLRAAHALTRAEATPDTRPEAPAMIETAKVMAAEQALLDAKLKRQESAFRQAEELGRAALQNELIRLDAAQAAGLLTEVETAKEKQRLLTQTEAKVEVSLKKQLELYRLYVRKKLDTFTEDEKAQQARLKFDEEAAAHEMELVNKISVTHLEADTVRIQSGLQVRTFWQKQLNDLVASNAFSVSQIVTTWTSGIANAIVNGGDFVKAAWQSTQVAIVQGALNTGVQLAAQWALSAATEVGIMMKAASAKVLGHTATEQAMTTVTTAQEAVRLSIVVASAKAMGAANAVAIASLTSLGLAAVGVLEAALIGITGFLAAVAAAVSPIPIVGQALAGSIIVGLTLAQVAGQAAIAAATAGIAAAGSAAAAGLSFQEGGVGQFGSGTTAMLHGPEAIIPLNRRGADFMREALGMGREESGRPLHVHVILKEREVGQAVVDLIPSGWRASGLPT